MHKSMYVLYIIHACVYKTITLVTKPNTKFRIKSGTL